MAGVSRIACFLPVLGVPTHVIKYGKISPDTKSLFLVIPGNPGVAEYYDQFMSELYKSSQNKVPVWGVSHAGHVTPDSQSEYLNKDAFTLDGQIKHKIKFIDDNIPSHITLYLIGHSIGCYIILKMIGELNDRGHKVGRCFQLFPTIERMAVSPNGKIHTPILKYFRWFAVWLVLVLSWLPEQLKLSLIRFHFRNEDTPQCVFDATLHLVDSFPVSNALFMANQEMRIVDKLDTNLVKKHLDCLSFYYGQTDGWCPQKYFRDMKEIFPEGDFRLCKDGHAHAFVVRAKSNIDLAQIIWDWVQPYLKK